MRASSAKFASFWTPTKLACVLGPVGGSRCGSLQEKAKVAIAAGWTGEACFTYAHHWSFVSTLVFMLSIIALIGCLCTIAAKGRGSCWLRLRARDAGDAGWADLGHYHLAPRHSPNPHVPHEHRAGSGRLHTVLIQPSQAWPHQIVGSI